MKKIINNKLYNTETATFIDSYENNWDYGNIHYYCEELYQKKTKEFFLYGHGGCYSKYGTCQGTTYHGGSNIIPLTQKEAQEWLQEYGHVDIYIELFGEPEE